MSKYTEYITLHANHYSCSSQEAVRYEAIRELCTEYRFMQGPHLTDTGTYFDYYKFGKMIEQEMEKKGAFGAGEELSDER